MSAVYKREFSSYFNSMIGYVFIAVVTFFIGLYFNIVNLNSGYPYFAVALSSLVMILSIAVPILTMKSMAEERKSKTDQMLMTYPVKVSSVVIGKFLAMMTVYAIPILIGCLCPIIIRLCGGSGSFLIDYSTALAILCMGCMFVAIGMFISALTESQMIAAIGAIFVLLVVYMWPALIQLIPDTAAASFIGFLIIFAVVIALIHHAVRNNLVTIILTVILIGGTIVCYFANSNLLAGLLPQILSVFSATTVISNFAGNYIFDISGLIMYLTIAALFVFLTIQVMNKRRWN
jgi:ABC-2 type transport system permease protein